MSGELLCWACGANNTETAGMTGAIDAKPKRGDVSVCLYCRVVAVFTGNRRRPPTLAELDEFAQDPRIPAAMTIATRVHISTHGGAQ